MSVIDDMELKIAIAKKEAGLHRTKRQERLLYLESLKVKK